VVLTGIMRSPESRKRLVASGIAVVETWDLTPNPIDMLVGFSHEKIGVAVARHLHAAGRRRVAVIAGMDERSRRRAQAFSEEAVRLGIAPPDSEQVPLCMVPAPTTLGSGRQGLRQLLQDVAAIDGVFCSSDILAMGVMIEAQLRGLMIPQQLAVMGFGDLSFSRDLHPQLTTVRIDGTGIGRAAAQFIIDRADGVAVTEPVLDVGFTIIERQSV
jgi:LacI family gluconate utilization system Gnt-I transcriptional repressor